MEKPFFDVLIVVPIGPGTNIDFVTDTISSYIFFTEKKYKFLIADDSHQNIGKQVQEIFSEIDIIKSDKNRGAMCGLYINLACAYKYAIDRYDFDVLLKLDTDALVIGGNPEKEALILFKTKNDAGIAGQYPYNYNGTEWDIEWPRKRLLNGMHTWKFIKRPFANLFLRKWYKMALKNGYKVGESVFGGAYFISKNLLLALDKNGLLPSYKFISIPLGEDHIFSLLAKALGRNLYSLSIGKLPFGCAWKGLPEAPEQLIKDEKKIIHSVRSWNGMNEAEIRNFFRNKRMETKSIFV